MSATMTTTDHSGVVQATLPPSDVVDTTLNYYLDPSLGGITWYTPGTAMTVRRKFVTRPVQIHDIRGHEEDFNINKQSFQLCKLTTLPTEFTDEEIRQDCYPEVEELLKNVTGATKVHVWSHLVRRDPPEANEALLAELTATAGSDSAIPDTQNLGHVVPAGFAHIDNSPIGARTLLHDHFQDKAADIMKSRWGIINIWRPLKTIRKDPLTLCDSRTVRDEDVVPVQAKLPPKGTGGKGYEAVSVGTGFETLELKANPDHRWYYVSSMQPDEAFVFKIFDSRDYRERVAHTAFKDPRYKNEPPRQSMEFRCFVFYEDQPAE